MTRKHTFKVFAILATILMAGLAGVAEAQQNAAAASAAGTLGTFRKIFVKSETVYMKSELLQSALRDRPEFTQWGLELALDSAEADVVIEVHRPFLSFDWTYDLMDRNGARLVSGYVVASEGHRAALRIAEAVMKHAAPARAADARGPDDVLRTFRKLYVESHTIYLKTDLVIRALRAQPGLQAWGLELVASPRDAEVTVTLHRPFMTYDWEFRMRHPASGRDVGNGMIVAWDGPTAAPQLAAVIMNHIGAARASDSRRPLSAPQPGKIAALPASAPPAAQPGRPLGAKEWPVRLNSGLGISRGTALSLGVAGENIQATSNGRLVFSVPTQDVVAVTYHSQEKSPSKDWWSFWDQAAAADSGGGATLLLAPIILAGAGIAELAGTGKEHFVTVSWRDSGRIREVELKVDSGHPGLLYELDTATRRKHHDVQDESAKLRQALERESANAIKLEFDRGLRVGWKEVPAGAYRLILLPGEGGRGDLYLFAGTSPDLDQPLAAVVVEVAARNGASGAVQITYRDENGIASLAEVRAGAHTLRFNSVPLVVSAQ